MHAEYAPNDPFVTGETPYTITRILSSGPAGGVYEVHHRRLGKPFVAKVLSRSVADDREIRERFMRGARALAHLDGHPGIVTIVDLGTIGNWPPVPYCIMEKLEGETLRAYLTRKKGQLPPRDALRIAIEILRALGYAHERNVVHRDCKCENTFLHHQVDHGRVTKVIDWFDIKIITDLDPMTTATFVGTRTNASPEQIEGGRITPATDLWSVAIVLFEMLTGRHPVTEGCRTQGQVNAAIVKRTPDRLSHFMPDVPDFLDEEVFTALSRDPTLRPRDAFAFARVLESARQYYRLRAPGRNEATIEQAAPADRGPLDSSGMASREWPIAAGRGEGEMRPLTKSSPDDTQPIDAAGPDELPTLPPLARRKSESTG
ncbi:serine/threonine protein kinase [Pendulispora brunnea]|uniref:Serine/threonine protein kinase n=1 Tax=Pendulispora brunnea TaxID=2905690 RepID=A0ABZ2KNL4_9BACT